MDAIDLLRLIIEIVCLALSVGALADTLWRDKTRTILVIVTSSLVLLSGVAVFLTWQHQHRVDMTSQEILRVIGPDVKTFDQVFQSLFQPEFPIANEAMGQLVKDGRVGYRQLEVRDDKGVGYTAGGYYRISN